VRNWKLGLFTIVLAGVTVRVSVAAAPVYRCLQNGQTVLTDKPCEGTSAQPSFGASAVSPGGAAAKQVSAPQSVVGDWRGQTQYQGSENGQQIGEAHTVVPLTMTFSADGKISGLSPDNGCRWLGVWSPGSTPRLFLLDVSFSGCRYAGFNRRFSGSLIATFPEQSAQLTLQAFDVFHPGQNARMYDIKATLRR
jgi:hypothetical protein